MRRQDEILTSFAGQPALAQKFIIAQAESLSLAFDSEDILSFLKGLIDSPQSPVRHQALHSLTRFLPGFVDKRYAVAAHLHSPWTRAATSLESPRRPAVGAPDRPGGAQGPREAWLRLASGPAARLAGGMRRSTGRLRTFYLLALGQLPLAGVRASLHEAARASPGDFETLLACALLAEVAGPDPVLPAQMREGAARCPDLLLLAGGHPQATYRLILDLVPASDTPGRINLALALGRLEGVDRTEGFDRLLRDRDPWVTVFCLHALERTGDPDHVALIQSVFGSSDDEFVRVHALRAAGFLGGDAARNLCLDVLGGSSERLRGQALESLVRLGTDPSSLREAALPLLESQSLKARVNAVLVAHLSGEERASGYIADMMQSGNALMRREAAYCLAYCLGPSWLPHLSLLAGSDPDRGVRVQAIKSIASHPAEQALPLLMPLLADEDVDVVRAASQGLTRYEGEEGRHVCEALALALQDPAPAKAFRQALLYQTLGSVAGRSGHTASWDHILQGLEHPDPHVVRGAVEGAKAIPGAIPEVACQRFRELCQSGDDGVVSRALLALFLGGEIEALDRLADQACSSRESAVAGALDTAVELGFLLASADIQARFPMLTLGLKSVQGPATSGAADEVLLDPGAERQAAQTRAPCAEIEEIYQSRMDTAPRARGTVRPPSPAPDRPAVTHEEPARPSGPRRPPVGPAALGKARGADTSRRPGAPFGSWQDWRGAVKGLSGKTALVLAGVAVLPLLGILVFEGTSGRDGGVSGAGRVHVIAAQGLVEMAPPYRLVRRGCTLRQGMTVSTGSHSTATLLDRKGGQIEMKASSKITFVVLEEESEAVEITVARGSCLFDYQKGGTIQVRSRDHVARGKKARFSLAESLGKFSVVVAAGSVSLRKGSSSEVELAPGESRALE